MGIAAARVRAGPAKGSFAFPPCPFLLPLPEAHVPNFHFTPDELALSNDVTDPSSGVTVTQ